MNTVIYHRADFDGIFCREIARKFLPDAQLIGWDYGDPKIPFPIEGTVYILDLSPDSLGGDTYDSSRIVWIDHHKSAIEKYPATIPGYRIDGVSACRLAWQWFSLMAATPNPEEFALPDKQHFYDRQVQEPIAVRLAGEYDIWDKRDPRAETLQFGLRTAKILRWDWLLGKDSELYTSRLVEEGDAVQRYQQQSDALSMQNSFLIHWEGLNFLAMNTQAKSSLAFASKDVPETGHDALLKFSFNGKIWDCSMYHAKHRSDIDLSLIAIKYGGGGHRGACGFRLYTADFLDVIAHSV